jgi:hypothetical protein
MLQGGYQIRDQSAIHFLTFAVTIKVMFGSFYYTACTGFLMDIINPPGFCPGLKNFEVMNAVGPVCF